MSTENKNLNEIGGWLYLFGFIYFREILGSALRIPSLLNQNLSNVILPILFFAFILYIAVVFLKKKKIAPKLIIAYFTLSLISSVIVFFTKQATQEAVGLIISVIMAAIWIPYFIVSKRVKNVFVK